MKLLKSKKHCDVLRKQRSANHYQKSNHLRVCYDDDNSDDNNLLDTHKCKEKTAVQNTLLQTVKTKRISRI